MNIVDLPTEALEIIFRHLPPVSLLSCCQAVPQFAQLINRDVFLDRYCQSLLQVDWIKWEKLVTARKSLPLSMEMKYLSAVANCHPNLTVKACDNLHAVGIFIYTLNAWLVNNEDIESGKKDQCIECHRTDFLHSVVTSRDAQQLFLKIAITVPEFINVTLMNNGRFSFCEGKTYSLDFLLFRNYSVNPHFLDGFKCEYCLEIILSQSVAPLALLAAGVLVSDDSWIGWTGHVDYASFRHAKTMSSCKLAISSSFEDTQEVLIKTFGHFSDYLDKDDTTFRGWRCTSQIPVSIRTRQEPLFIKFGLLLESLASKVSKKVNQLRLPNDTKNLLKQYLDGYKQKKSLFGINDTYKRSSTLFVAVLRYLHRVLNSIFYNECRRYLQNRDCAECLINLYQKRKGITQLTPFEQFHEHLTIHHLPPILWPNHLLLHVMKAAPVVNRLVQVDIILWTKRFHCKPLSSKLRHFLMDQTASCGLSHETWQLIYPPLCGLVRYDKNEDSDEEAYKKHLLLGLMGI